ncbi:MAG: hypothetical protein ACRBB3_01710 [Alphaproteobacteria bacterium]
MRIKILLLAILIIPALSNQSFAFDYNFSRENIEGVTIDMTVGEAIKVLKSQGYKEKHRMRKGLSFEKDGKYIVKIASDITRLSNIENPGAENEALTEVIYEENISKIVDIYQPETRYVCPKAKDIYGKFCPQAGEEACKYKPSLRIKTDTNNDLTKGGFWFEVSAITNRRCQIMIVRKMSKDYQAWDYSNLRDILGK